MLRVETHCHTTSSRDGLTSPAQLVAVCRRKGIDRVIVTDHNSIQGAIAARDLDPDRVIVGEEIMTQNGELLAAFVKERIPRGLPPHEAIRRLRDQGAFISVSHPFDQRRGWALADLLEIVPVIDAIETFNSRCPDNWPNVEARAFAEEHGLAGTVGSDAHCAYELGRAVLLVPEFHTADDLRSVIRQAEYHCSLSGSWVHVVSFYARIHKMMFSSPGA